jgi:myo-inositol-1(or 4)-monophosphatase
MTRIDNQAIEALIRDIGAYQLEGHKSLVQADITIKDDTSHGYSVVTEYDEKSERRVFQFLTKHFPSDSFLGEEHGNVTRDPSRYWVLDPIDGTSNFTQGVAYWGPSLALIDEKGPERGWVYFPVLDQMFHAVRGEGAFLDGKPIQTSTISEYTNLCTVGTVSRLHRRDRLTCPAKHRILGSIIVNLCYLATGSFVATHFRGSIWDLAAGWLIAREAGAVIDCDPALDTLDLTKMTPKDSPSICCFAMANDKLPHLRDFIVPLDEPITGK